MNQIPVSVKGKSVLIALLACVQLNLFGGVKSVGVSFVENYPKELYNAGTQVWSIDQDRNGIMYFGNNSGLLTFDSQGWRLYPVPNHSIVRSVMVGDDERIYVGSFNDFGYFTPDDRGELVYQSFLSRVPEENREFGEIWNIMYYKGGIIFHSYTAVFFLKDDQIKIVSYNRDLHFAFQVGNEYYVKENNRGILHLVDDKLQFVRHSDFFADYQISAIIPYGEDKLMVLTRENGIFILDNQGVMLYNTPLQAFFRNHQIFSATKTDDDFLILGTVQNGVVILDKKGNLVQHLNRNRGLQNNTVLSVFVDKTENLWLGLDNGIDFVLINSPLSYIAHESEIGTVYVMTLKKDDLYIGTNQGLYVTGWPPAPRLATSASDIEFIEGSQGQVWSLQTIHNIILVGHDKGTFIADQRKLTRLNSIQGGWTFIEVPERPGIILEGTYSGLLKYSYQPAVGGWKFVCPVEGFNESCRQIQFDNKGDLWIGHGYKGVYRLRYNERLDSIIAVRHYSEESGLPSRYESNVLKFNDEIIIGTQDGIYIYNPEQDLFEKNIELSGLFDNKNVHNLIEDQNGNLWFFGQDEAGILKSNFDGSYSKTTKPFHPVREKMIVNYEHVYPIDRSNILFSTEEGVIHFDPDFRKDYKEPFGVTIRRVEILPDSFIFGGYSLENINGYERNTIKYKNNSLRFRYSALSYEFPSRNEYSIYLEGFDTKWSDWSETTEKEYTNLHNGQYRFRVRARNIYGNESEAEPYLFAILPPWYQSTLAYILYILFFILLVIMIIRTVVANI